MGIGYLSCITFYCSGSYEIRGNKMGKEKCVKCGRVCGDSYSQVDENRELVIMDEKTQVTIVLWKGNCLCDDCGRVVTYYRRIKE